jgi:hypothetical protein
MKLDEQEDSDTRLQENTPSREPRSAGCGTMRPSAFLAHTRVPQDSVVVCICLALVKSYRPVCISLKG